MQSTESDIVLDSNNFVTSKAFVNTIRYYYNSEDTLTKKCIKFADNTEHTVNFEKAENDSQIVKFVAGGKTITSHSKTDNLGRKVFDELQLSTGFVSRQFSYHVGEATDNHIENNMLKSSPTTQLVSQIVLSNGRTLSYEYDAEERITKITDSVDGITEYTYDALGQLLTEVHKDINGQNAEVVNEMVYDAYGNILQKNGIQYVYDEVWKDKFTRYNGQEIIYDEQGNPTKYLGHNLTWEKGRQLKSFDNISYTYNANGIRTSKTIDGIRHDFVLDGDKILRETWDDDILETLYDNEDSVCGIIYNGEPYYFHKNLQGDIIAIADDTGRVVARYTYDAWGKCEISATSTNATIANINPYRYRGYYYDKESGLCYLKSRYFSPDIGRFINSDNPNCFETNDRCVSCDLFAYCENDPTNLTDVMGAFSWSIFSKVVKFLTGLIGKLSEFLLKTYGISKKKYLHKLKYNNANALTKFVNNNKKKIKKIGRGFSAIANCLEIIIICSECFGRIKSAGKNILKAVASLVFYGTVSVLGKIASKIASWILSKLIAALFWARFLIELIIECIIDWILDGEWIKRMETKFVEIIDKNKMTIGSYFVKLFQSAKAICA